jgi:NAD(P)H-hydrate repair Nnr-like enzyme with NAD(P)H-hydrate dehydratase domain
MNDWLTQTTTEPLFGDVWWSRPEHKRQAGSIVIIGGHTGSAAQLSTVFSAATDAGIGEVKLATPRSLKPLLQTVPEAHFLPNTSSGTLSETSETDLIAFVRWSNGLALVDPGENSETSLLLSRLLSKESLPALITESALPVIAQDLSQLKDRPNTVMSSSVSGIQQLLKAAQSDQAVRHDMGVRPYTLALKQLTTDSPLFVISMIDEKIIVAHGGEAIVTPASDATDLTALSVFGFVWMIQQPQTPLESVATGVWHGLYGLGKD